MDAAFRIARETSVKTIAVPAVGTGIAGFPLDECARIMAACVKRAFSDGWQPDEVRFVLYDEAAMHAFRAPFHAVYQD
jgi:O-acetyl-ADP-ribose deacetylase (regulator of RNase III)